MVDLLSVYEREREEFSLKRALEILIFSDSHGDVSRMRGVIEKHPNATHVLFCGDGLNDVRVLEKEFSSRVFISVTGNCDGLFSSTSVPYERCFTLGGHRIMMMHGHTHGVKGGYGAIASHAVREGADILLFGHTHIPFEGRMEVGEATVHLFNPGSIGTYTAGAPSFGVLVIKENGYLLSHGTPSASLL